MKSSPPTTSPARLIAAELGETRFRPIGTIKDLVGALGPDRVWSLAREAQAVDTNGGMLVTNGSRRRTLGGVFFELAKAALAPEDRALIFDMPWERERARRRQLYLDRAANRQAQQWTVELVHVRTGRSSDAVAPRIVLAAQAGLTTYSSPGEAQAAGEAAIQTALAKLFGSRLKSIVPPRIEVRAVGVLREVR